MGKKLALVNKLKRREKRIRNAADSFDRVNKMNREEETMAKSQKAYMAMRKIARRLDRNFGVDAINQEPKLSKRNNITTVERYDFGGSDFGTRLTMASSLIDDMGILADDIVLFLEGLLKGQYLKVVEVIDATHLRLEDADSLNYAGAKERTKVTCVADVSGSLDGTYFTLNSANDATDYYVWLDVDAGGNDPAPMGLTGIPVSISSDDSAEDVAMAVRAAVDANLDFAAAQSEDAVYIENVAVGDTADAADNDTGFDVSVLTQGADADATLSESNIVARFQLSDVKASHT